MKLKNILSQGNSLMRVIARRVDACSAHGNRIVYSRGTVVSVEKLYDGLSEVDFAVC